LQSLREVPGFLSFTVIFVLLVIKEQTFAVISLALLGPGRGHDRFLSLRVRSVLYDGVDEHWFSLL
jgi:hypothetical protein